jgi:tRNA-dihydrouridine synthase
VLAREWGIACNVARIGIPPDLLDQLITQGVAQAEYDSWSFSHDVLRDSLMAHARTAGRWELLHHACAAALDQLYARHTPGAPERIALAAEQLRALVAAKGDHGLLIARKHMGWTCQRFPGAPQLRHALMRAPTPDEALALLDCAAQQLQPQL